MQLFRKFVLPLLILTCSATAFSQQFAVRESEATLRGFRHLFLHSPGDDDIIAISYTSPDFKDPVIFNRFDPKSISQQKATSSLAELSKEHLRAAMYAGNRLFLICSNKDGIVNRYEVNDKTGALIGAATQLFDLKAKEDGVVAHFGSSPDNNYHYLLLEESPKHEDGKLLEGIILDNQMNKVTTFSYQTSEIPQDRPHLDPDAALTNNGTLSLIYGTAVKTSKDDFTPLVYMVVRIAPTGKTNAGPLAGLPAGLFGNISWIAHENTLGFTGWLSLSKKTGFTSIVTGTLEPDQKKVSGIRTTEIRSLISRSPDFVQEELGKKGVSTETSLVHTLTLSDGSTVQVLETGFGHNYSWTQRANASGASARMSASFIHRSNAYVVKVDNTGTPLWLNMISKYQTESNFVMTMGLACAPDERNNIHVFFNENPKNTEPTPHSPSQYFGSDYKSDELTCVSIAPDGSMKKQFIPLDDHSFRFLPDRAGFVRNNEFLFVRLKPKYNFSLSDDGMFVGAYRFGVITIK